MGQITNEIVEEEKVLELSDVATLYWNYYQLHAEQRMKILEFFISVEGVLFGAAFAVGSRPLSLFAYFAAIIVAVICFLMDIRTTALIHYSRVALRQVEESYLTDYPSTMKLFTQVKQNENRINYSRLIRTVYILVPVVSIVLLIIA